MKPPRVLTIQPMSNRGGPSVLHLAFLRRLAEIGLTCHALLPPEHELEDEYRAACEGVHILGPLQTVPRSKSPITVGRFWTTAASTSARIASLAQKIGAEAIYTCGEAFPTGGLAARRARIPSIIHVIGMSMFSPPIVGLIYSNLLGALADRLICGQRALQERFLATGVPPRKIEVVYNSIDPRAVIEEAAAAPEPPSEANTVRIGVVGGVDRRKGQLRFVRAAARVASAAPRARFFIVGSTSGDPDYHQEIRSAIAEEDLAERVTVTGAVANATSWIASFDICCVPSDTEALPLAGLEAMALGRPVVATAVGGNPEMVIDGVTGLLSRPDDAADLADKILRLTEDPELRARFGTRGRETVEAGFNIRTNGARLSEVITTVSRR